LPFAEAFWRSAAAAQWQRCDPAERERTCHAIVDIVAAQLLLNESRFVARAVAHRVPGTIQQLVDALTDLKSNCETGLSTGRLLLEVLTTVFKVLLVVGPTLTPWSSQVPCYVWERVPSEGITADPTGTVKPVEISRSGVGNEVSAYVVYDPQLGGWCTMFEVKNGKEQVYGDGADLVDRSVLARAA
jgi:hypothetical protein